MNRCSIDSRWRYPFVSLAVAAGLALIAGGSSATGATQTRPPAAAGATATDAAHQASRGSETPAPQLLAMVEAPEEAPNYAVLAKTLAAKVARARTFTARYAALLDVMRALNVGVYSAKGEAIVRGAERNVDDDYLYEFQLRILAGALGDRQTADLTDLRKSLAAAGVKARGQPVDEQTLWQALLRRVRGAVSRPGAESSLVPLLVRELGLRAQPPSDILRVEPDQMRFDALQRFLIEASLTLPLPYRPAASSEPTGSWGTDRGGVPSADCERFTGSGQSLLRGSPETGWTSILRPAARHYTAVLIHLMMGLRAVRLTPQNQETHKGPPGHQRHGSVGVAGQVLRIRLRLESQAVFRPEVIRCFRLAGYRLPQPGPIPGARMSFSPHQSSRGGLPLEHLVSGSVSGDGKTETDGTVTLVITPLNERTPGVPPRELVGEWKVSSEFFLFGTKWFADVVQGLPPEVSRLVGAHIGGINHERWVPLEYEICSEDSGE